MQDINNEFVKVINSTYNLLDFFPDHDPLKNKAKERALKVLEGLTLLSSRDGWTSLKTEITSAELLDDIEILKNYLKLAKHQRWIGGINCLILLKEYDKIAEKIPLPSKAIQRGLESIVKEREDKPLIEDEELKESLKFKVETSNKALKRQQKILEIIGNKGKAQVADIIREIPNITKRTIRRDLDELLRNSKIVRKGEWNQVFYEAL